MILNSDFEIKKFVLEKCYCSCITLFQKCMSLTKRDLKAIKDIFDSGFQEAFGPAFNKAFKRAIKPTNEAIQLLRKDVDIVKAGVEENTNRLLNLSEHVVNTRMDVRTILETYPNGFDWNEIRSSIISLDGRFGRLKEKYDKKLRDMPKKKSKFFTDGKGNIIVHDGSEVGD